MRTRVVKTFLLAAIVFFGLSLFATKAFAVPADGAMKEYKQPNGMKFFAALHGDEWFNWLESRNGDILAQGDNGYWYYGELSGGKVQPTDARYLIDQKPDRALAKESLENSANVKSAVSSRYGSKKIQPDISTKLLKNKLSSKSITQIKDTYTEPMVIFLINYQDQKLNYAPGDYTNLFFNTNTNSVNRFYDDVSEGLFQFYPITEEEGIENDGIITVTLPFNHPNPAENIDSTTVFPIIIETLMQASPYIDFSQYDTDHNGYVTRDELHTVFVSAGWEFSYGQVYGPSIWAHSWALQDFRAYGEMDYRFMDDGVYVCSYDDSGNVVKDGGYTIQSEMHGDHLMTMGTVSHELGHDIGLPDEYDYGYDSEGVGVHSIMASGSWAAAPGGYAGSSPTYMDGFCRWYLGFADTQLADEKGKYNVRAITLNQDAPDLLYIPSANEYEFFLLENRQYKGFDDSLRSYTKSGGIMIEHVDLAWLMYAEENGLRINDNQDHKAIDVEEANEGKLGYSQLDNNITRTMTFYDHYYYTGGNTSFTSKTVPNSNLYDGSMSADISITSKSAAVMSVNITSIADLVPPEIVSVSPSLKLTTIPDMLANKRNIETLKSKPTKIQIKFSEPVFPNNAGYQTGTLGYIYLRDMDHGVVVQGELTIVKDTVTITPQVPLVPGVLYRLRIAGESLKDQYGNIFPVQTYENYWAQFYEYYFNILDKEAPSVKEATVKNNQTGVNVEQELAFNFGEDIAVGTAFNNVTLKDAKKRTVPVTVMISEENPHLLIVTPVGGVLQGNMKYTLTIPSGAVKDKAGNASKSYTVSFTTADTAPPTVLRYSLKNSSMGPSVTVTFDERVCVTDAALVCFRDASGNVIKANVKVSNNMVYITPAQKLQPGVEYILEIGSGAVKDESGNLLTKIYTIDL